MRLVIWICVLLVSASCILAGRAKPSAKSVSRTDELTVFLTGNELGALQPCGCSGGQLGGLDRRLAVFNKVPASNRLIVDIGSFVETDSEQDIIKFNIIIEALGLLDYDLINLAEKDFQITQNLELLEGIGSVFNVISSRSGTDVNIPATFTKQFSLRGEKMAVTVAVVDTQSEPMNLIGQLFPFAVRPDLRSVNILILNTRDTAAIDKIAKMGIVDCFIVPAESDEPEIISAKNERPLVLSVGRLGKYIGKLQIKTEPNSGGLALGFSAAAVTEDLPQENSLVQLYKDYQQIVKEANLLERQSRFSLPDGLKYTGSKSCSDCHEYEYQKWSSQVHAHAYATLEKVGSQFDPECVSCHVVGLKYQSGFVSQEKTPHLKDVGCENCHGPAGEHVKTFGEVLTAEPKSSCADCHTPEHSADYAANEERYFKKIIHWREP